MTTDSAPRIKITYATLSADNEELHAAVRGGPRDGAGEPRRPPPATTSTARGAMATARSRCARRSIATSLLGHVRARHRGRRRRRRRRRPSRPARLGRRPVARARRDRQARRRPHQRTADGLLRRHGDRGRQEPDRGARRGRGIGRPAALLRLDDGGQRRLRPRDGQPRRRGGPHPLDPPAARRVRGHQPVQLPDGAGDRPDRRGAPRPATRSCSSRRSASPLSAVKPAQGLHRCRRPEGRRQPRHGPGRDGRPDAPGPPGRRRHRVHRLVRGRDAAVPLVLEGVAAPDHRRDGRQEPGDRLAQGRPRGGGRGDHAQRLRLRRARSARPTRGSTSSGRSTTSSSGCSSRRPRRSPSATRSSAPTGWARSSTSGRSTGTRPRSPRRAATGPSSPAAST